MTGVRWRVLSVLSLLSFLTIVDRVCISAAKPEIAADLQIPDQMFGFVCGAFALGYAVFMVPSGWAADRLGPRRFLAIIVGAWSLFTLQTGLVSAVPLLIGVRFLFGAAEAGAFPTAARAIYGWLPAGERGLALGLLNTGSRMGAAIGLSLMSAAIAAMGWRSSFLILGGVGLLWAVWWFYWYRDDPSQKTGVSSAELAWIRAGRMNDRGAKGKVGEQPLLSRDSVFVVLQYFCSNFTFFLCFSWLLPYLRQHFQIPAQQAAFYASLPLYCGALATWTGGITVDALFRRGRWNLSRRLPAMSGFGLAAICLLLAARCETVGLFILWFSLTTFGVDFTLSPSWSASSDIGGLRTGTLSASMNMLGSVGSFTSSVAFPWLLQRTGSVSTYFALASALNLAAVLLWSGIRLAPDSQGKRSLQ
jgi:MFS transporter, ACS family, glucarate transporter